MWDENFDVQKFISGKMTFIICLHATHGSLIDNDWHREYGMENITTYQHYCTSSLMINGIGNPLGCYIMLRPPAVAMYFMIKYQQS